MSARGDHGELSRRGFLRLTVTVATALGGGMVLAACGQSASPSAPTSAPATAPTSPPAAAPTTAPTAAAKAPAQGAKPKLSFWGRREFADDLNNYLEKQVKDFAARSSFDLDVTFTPIGEEEQAKWKAAAEAGTLPDVGIGGNFNEHIYTGIARDVATAVDEAGKAGGGWFDWALKYVTFEGKVWGFPYAGYPWVTYYWKTLFKDAGYTLPLKDFDQLLEAAKKITKPEKDLYAIGFPFASTDTPMHVAEGVWGFGGAVQDKDGNPTMNTPEAIEGVAWYADLYGKHKVVPPGTTGWTPVDNNNFYINRKGAVCYNLGSLTYALRKQDQALLDDTYLGTLPSGPKAPTPCVVGVQVMIVTSTTKNFELATALAKQIVSPQVYPTILNMAGGLISPCLKDPAKDKFFTEDPYNKPVMELILPGGRNLGYPGPDTPWLNEATSQNWWPQALQAIVLKNTSPKDAVAELQKNLEQSKAKFERARKR